MFHINYTEIDNKERVIFCVHLLCNCFCCQKAPCVVEKLEAVQKLERSRLDFFAMHAACCRGIDCDGLLAVAVARREGEVDARDVSSTLDLEVEAVHVEVVQGC